MDALVPYTHIGWVPCISGKLFFEFTLCGLGKDSIHADVNYEDSVGRHIIVSSVVDWKDEYKKKSGEPCDLSGSYRIILRASFTPGAEQLAGCVCILPVDIARSDWKNVDSHVRKIINLIQQREDIHEEASLLDSFLEEFQHAKYHRIVFQLNDHGFVKLRQIKNRGSQITSLEEDTLIRQAYYYIKYSWHKHQHHNDTAESLTTTHRVSEGDTNFGINIINDLKKSLVILKRDFHISDFRGLLHAKGISSYAKSLVISCNKEGYISDNEKRAQLSYFENVSRSLEILAESVQRDIDVRNMISSSFRAIMLFVLAVVAPITILYREDIQEITGHVKAGDLFIVDAIAKIVSDGASQLFVVGLVLFVFLSYRFINLKMGAVFIASQLVKDTIDLIVKEKYKAHFFSWVGYSVAGLCIIWGIYTLVRG